MDFVFDSLAVSAASDCDADLPWLAEFFGPACRVREEDGRAIRAVRLRADGPLHAAYSRAVSRAANTAVGFVMDGGAVTLPAFRDGPIRVAHDPVFDVFYRIGTPHSVEVIDRPTADPRTPRRARGALMRVVREWAMYRARADGHLALHAAGIARSGQGVLFAGAKRSGKTTLTAACLLGGAGWGLLANDRILLRRRGSAWQCRGMASIVSVRPGSFGQLPGLADRLASVTGGAFARVDESVAPAPLVDGRTSLSPAGFAMALGTSLVGEARLHAVALPSIDGDGEGLLCRSLGPGIATARLEAALFAAATPLLRSELFEEPGEVALPDEAALRSSVAGLVAEVPCVEIALGRSAYASAAVSELLHSLVG